MEKLYRRLLVKNLEIASGPSYPGPACDTASCYTNDTAHFVFYEGDWYQIFFKQVETFISLLLSCKNEFEISYMMSKLEEDRKVIDLVFMDD